MSEIPTGPLEREPAPLFLPATVRRFVLAEVLDGVELGAWDHRIIEWLAGLDTSTTLTIASLIARARAAGVDGGVEYRVAARIIDLHDRTL